MLIAGVALIVIGVRTGIRWLSWRPISANLLIFGDTRLATKKRSLFRYGHTHFNGLFRSFLLCSLALMRFRKLKWLINGNQRTFLRWEHTIWIRFLLFCPISIFTDLEFFLSCSNWLVYLLLLFHFVTKIDDNRIWQLAEIVVSEKLIFELLLDGLIIFILILLGVLHIPVAL